MQSNYPFDVSLLKSSNVPMAKVQKGDVVRIADSDLDFLQEFYNTRYDGNPIKPFASRFAIAIKNDMNNTEYKNDLILLYVRSLDDGAFIQVDMYQKSVGDRILWTEVLDNSKVMEVVDGHFFMESYSIHREGGLYEYAHGNEEQITTYISDVVHYVLFFMQENLENPEYVTKKVETHTETSGKPVKKGKKKPAKKTVRSTMYVPKRIVSYEGAADTSKEQNSESSKVDSKRIYTGHTEEWHTKGYKRRIQRKDGSIDYIDVKPSVRKRNPALLAKGQEKGRDIKLRSNKIK